jgi:hypothetical protein
VNRTTNSTISQVMPTQIPLLPGMRRSLVAGMSGGVWSTAATMGALLHAFGKPILRQAPDRGFDPDSENSRFARWATYYTKKIAIWLALYQIAACPDSYNDRFC